MIQLSLIDQFNRSFNRQEHLVTQLIKEIQNLKYYRILSRFGGLPYEKNINTILYWVAILAYNQSKGLETHRGKNQASFLDLTIDGRELSITDPIEPEMVKEYYNSGYKRMRTLLMAHKDLLRDDLKSKDRILTNYEVLLNIN